MAIDRMEKPDVLVAALEVGSSSPSWLEANTPAMIP